MNIKNFSDEKKAEIATFKSHLEALRKYGVISKAEQKYLLNMYLEELINETKPTKK